MAERAQEVKSVPKGVVDESLSQFKLTQLEGAAYVPNAFSPEVAQLLFEHVRTAVWCPTRATNLVIHFCPVYTGQWQRNLPWNIRH